eukprot:1790365-Rhodomonas_salina.1
MRVGGLTRWMVCGAVRCGRGGGRDLVDKGLFSGQFSWGSVSQIEGVGVLEFQDPRPAGRAALRHEKTRRICDSAEAYHAPACRLHICCRQTRIGLARTPSAMPLHVHKE